MLLKSGLATALRWPVLVFVLAVAVFFVTAFTVRSIRRSLRLPIIGVLAALLAGTLLVITDLAFPFTGISRVGPEAMERATVIMTTNYSDYFDHAAITMCNSRGEPR